MTDTTEEYADMVNGCRTFADWRRGRGKLTQDWLNENMAPEGAPVEMVWVDIETSGLDPYSDELLEVVFMVTDKRGRYIADFGSVFHVDKVELVRGRSNEIVRQMHDKSELWLSCSRESAVSVEEADEQFTEFLDRHLGPTGRKFSLAGSSVHFDHRWLNHYFPEMMGKFFNHRHVDVSTLGILCWMHNEPLAEDLANDVPQAKLHRGFSDIVDSIRMYQAYLDEFLWTEENAATLLEAVSKEDQ